MATDLIAYVQQDLITYWKQLSLFKPYGGKPTFLYSCNGAGQFERYARRNATLWVVATRPSEPPALVAKLGRIERVGEEIKESQVDPEILYQFSFRDHVSMGRSGSRFFAHNDVSQSMFDMTYLSVNDIEWEFPKAGRDSRGQWRWDGRRNGNLLRNPFRVASGAAKLEDFAKAITDKAVFVSYKRRDHRGNDKKRRLAKFVRALVLLGYSVWFDRIALPESRVAKQGRIEFDERQQDQMLTTLLRYGLKNSKAVIVISSACYGTPSRKDGSNWTLKEFNSVTRKRRRAIWQLYDLPESDVKIDPREVLCQTKSPQRAAEAFDRWFKR